MSEFEHFADFTVEILDTWPGFIRDNLDQYLRETDSRIGMWNYTITRELPSSPGTAIPLPSPLRLGAVLLGLIWVLIFARSPDGERLLKALRSARARCS